MQCQQTFPSVRSYKESKVLTVIFQKWHQKIGLLSHLILWEAKMYSSLDQLTNLVIIEIISGETRNCIISSDKIRKTTVHK